MILMAKPHHMCENSPHTHAILNCGGFQLKLSLSRKHTLNAHTGICHRAVEGVDANNIECQRKLNSKN
jgi:hypothetical protein